MMIQGSISIAGGLSFEGGDNPPDFFWETERFASAAPLFPGAGAKRLKTACRLQKILLHVKL